MLSEIADNTHASNINNAYKIVKHMEEKRSLDGQNEKMKNSTPVWNIHREVHIPGYWLYAECLPHCLAQEQFDFVSKLFIKYSLHPRLYFRSDTASRREKSTGNDEKNQTRYP